jgi:hydrogenase/urease accessory protein HupE
MKTLTTISLILLPSAVSAHVGHLGEALGHDHLLGAAAIGAAIALGLWASLKGTKKTDEEVADEDVEEAQET